MPQSAIVDVLVLGRDDKFVCIIENKIGSGEHSDQLRRYLETIESEYEGLKPFPIFLTPTGIEPQNEDDIERYVPIDYGMIANLIERTLETRGSTISASVTDFLEQYGRMLRRHVLNDKDNIDELANRIYDNHRAAIDLIIRAKSNRDTTDWGIIESVVKQFEPEFQADNHTKSIRRYFSSSLDEIDELRNGEGWTESRRILLFEVKYVDGELRLYLMMGPGPMDTRERLTALADNTGVFMRRPGKLRKWHRIYRKPILSQEDFGSPASDINSKVEQALREFYENDYWLMINAVREEFGKPAISSG